MKGIVASVVFLLALCSVAGASESAPSNPSTDTEGKSKSDGHARANATQSSKPLKAILKTPAIKDDDDDRAGGKFGGHGRGAADDDGVD